MAYEILWDNLGIRESRVASPELRVASCESRVASCESHIASCKFTLAIHDIRVVLKTENVFMLKTRCLKWRFYM